MAELISGEMDTPVFAGDTHATEAILTATLCMFYCPLVTDPIELTAVSNATSGLAV